MSGRRNTNPRRSRGRGRSGTLNNRAERNAHLLLDTFRSLPNGALAPISDARDGYGRRDDLVPTDIPRNINDQIVWSRFNYSTTNNLSASIELNTAASFRLALHPEASSFEAIFDQYCIVAVKITTRSVENMSQLAGNQNQPRVYTVLDHDDANAITVAQAKEYASCLEQRITETTVRILYPRIAIASYSGAFTSFANGRMWIDCASDSVQHYGFKLSAEVDGRTGGPSEILIAYEIYYAFRNRH